MIIWTDYLKYRGKLRGLSLAEIEEVLRYSEERYLDTKTLRRVVVGRVGERLVMVPYAPEGDRIVPVTVHAITRQQINFRLQSGRFRHE